MYISQKKRQTKKNKKMVTNGKKCPKIANNCKVPEITKYGEKKRTNDKKMYKNAKNEPKKAKKWPNLKTKNCIVFLTRNYPKIDTVS